MCSKNISPLPIKNNKSCGLENREQPITLSILEISFFNRHFSRFSFKVSNVPRTSNHDKCLCSHYFPVKLELA